jgi:hypothetical protein
MLSPWFCFKMLLFSFLLKCAMQEGRERENVVTDRRRLLGDSKQRAWKVTID